MEEVKEHASFPFGVFGFVVSWLQNPPPKVNSPTSSLYLASFSPWGSLVCQSLVSNHFNHFFLQILQKSQFFSKIPKMPFGEF